MDPVQTTFLVLSCIIIAVALSACCGFKVFVPPLIISIFCKAGLISLGESFQWMGSWAALAVLGLATIVEIIAYFFPVVNNALDTIKIPLAVIAGTLTASAAMSSAEISPLIRWALAVICGGGTAAAVSTGMAALRAAGNVATGGASSVPQNCLEAAISSLLSAIAALATPIVLCLVLILVTVLLVSLVKRIRHQRSAQES